MEIHFQSKWKYLEMSLETKSKKDTLCVIPDLCLTSTLTLQRLVISDRQLSPASVAMWGKPGAASGRDRHRVEWL